MTPKKFIQAIRNHNLGLQERMFRLLVMIGMVGLAIAIIVGMIAGENEANTIPILLAFILFSCITCFSIHFRKIQLGAVLIACIIIYFVMPVNFLTSGRLYGGGPIWLLFGVVFVCLVVEKRIKYVLIASSFFICAV